MWLAKYALSLFKTEDQSLARFRCTIVLQWVSKTFVNLSHFWSKSWIQHIVFRQKVTHFTTTIVAAKPPTKGELRGFALLENFLTPLEKCVGHFKTIVFLNDVKFAPLQKTSRPLLCPKLVTATGHGRSHR